MGMVVRLVQRQASQETIDVLTALLAEARRGEIVGLAYVAMHQRMHYTADVKGAAKTLRAYTVCALRHLEAHLLED